MLIPFTAISGQGTPNLGSAISTGLTRQPVSLGLTQQISLLLDAELPVSASSDATYSAPLDPVTPITGLTGIDRTIWDGEIFTNQTPYPLIDNWFHMPLSDLTVRDLQLRHRRSTLPRAWPERVGPRRRRFRLRRHEAGNRTWATAPSLRRPSTTTATRSS